MTWVDGVIVLIVAIILGSVIYKMIKTKDNPCERCAYAKHCTDGCSIVPKKRMSKKNEAKKKT
ncbi:MAG: FeoB-associated Cys-rich membrane protein [Acholeplasmataceae bacterium]|nr:FeoB-associated Cys-rich membrane protein [Acholeplasmataceae bacterium]